MGAGPARGGGDARGGGPGGGGGGGGGRGAGGGERLREVLVLELHRDVEVALGERHRRDDVDRRGEELDQATELDGVVAVADQAPLLAGERARGQRQAAHAVLLVERGHRVRRGPQGDH